MTLLSQFFRSDLTLAPKDVLYLVERAEAFGLSTDTAKRLRLITEMSVNCQSLTELRRAVGAVGISSAKFSTFRHQCISLLNGYIYRDYSDPVGFAAKFDLCPGSQMEEHLRRLREERQAPFPFRAQKPWIIVRNRKVIRTCANRAIAAAFLEGFKLGQENPKTYIEAL